MATTSVYNNYGSWQPLANCSFDGDAGEVDFVPREREIKRVRLMQLVCKLHVMFRKVRQRERGRKREKERGRVEE